MQAKRGNYTINYWKYSTTSWQQPLIWANGNYGVDELAVYRAKSPADRGEFKGYEAYGAFCTTSGYSGSRGSRNGYYTGLYRDEARITLYLYMAVKNPIKVTRYTFFNACCSSNNEWSNPVISGGFQVSNDNVNWITVHTHGNVGEHSAFDSGNFYNNGYFKYHRYYGTTKGEGHRDEIDIASFRLYATQQTVIPGTANDYDFFTFQKGAKLIRKENKTYAVANWVGK